MADRELEGDPPAQAEADDVGGRGAEVPQQRGRVLGQLLVGQRPVDVGGPAVPLQLGRDHPPGAGQPGAQPRHHVRGHVGAVEQHQRRPVALDLVVHRERADLRVSRLHERSIPLPGTPGGR